MDSVHPHVRGDNGSVGDELRRPIGSPPRAWGQWPLALPPTLPVRFTPTCVGTMRYESFMSNRISVHPHVRGDNDSMCFRQLGSNGSPPRAWGQLIVHPSPYPIIRFTPTCVGTMLISNEVFKDTTVHPHVRGYNDKFPNGITKINGSPPRAWGQCLASYPLVRNNRFTPTCVGTMSSIISSSEE